MSSTADRSEGGTTTIFVNHRREDSAGYAGRLFDSLRRQYGADSVFWDISGSIEPGVSRGAGIQGLHDLRWRGFMSVRRTNQSKPAACP